MSVFHDFHSGSKDSGVLSSTGKIVLESKEGVEISPLDTENKAESKAYTLPNSSHGAALGDALVLGEDGKMQWGPTDDAENTLLMWQTIQQINNGLPVPFGFS